jgi:hypothetical protein
VQAGIQECFLIENWIPALAGKTNEERPFFLIRFQENERQQYRVLQPTIPSGHFPNYDTIIIDSC